MQNEQVKWAYKLNRYQDEREMATASIYEDTGYNHKYIALVERAEIQEVEKISRLIVNAREMKRVLYRVLDELTPDQFDCLSAKTQDDLINVYKAVDNFKEDRPIY